MFDTGSVLTGPRALEFFAPEAKAEKAPWDFYVPGFKESAADMVIALSLCGVTWQLGGDAITSALDAEGRVEVDTEELKAILSWVRHLERQNAIAVLGLKLQEVMAVFKQQRSHADRYLITKEEGGELRMRPAFFGQARPTPSTNRFHIMRGQIRAENRTQGVRLLIDRDYNGIGSFLQFLSESYDSRLYCFMSGWCASHMSYYDTISSRSHALAPKKYEAQGIDSTQSFFLDYGDIYRPYLRRVNLPLLDLWLKERRETAGATRWVVMAKQLVMTQGSGDDWPRSDATFAEKSWTIPLSRFRRLGDLIALNMHVPNRLRCPSYLSSVRRTMSGDEWFAKSIARSGSVFGPLPHASPLSGVMN